ncbi:SDR family oxidoreductase [Saliniramus sp.]|uniref:SDR family NAD(P)-dependent oxidoreductase n=1 Tax=Saliniramus sp. TaxID=2986772 RepID=UPI002C2D2D79|nr:SDR family oxidoreductase [Saliniramus sp.]HMB10725.1 SDR family oxidoreductase [Saliniramus sp.]
MANIRWTVVTGASGGIGAEMARVFSGIGHNLVLVARRRDRLEALAEELRKRDGGLVEVIEADLADPEAPQALFDAIAAKEITVHTLVNNAGFGLGGDFVDRPIAEHVNLIDVNIGGLTRLCHLFLPGMLERRQGGIINVASLASFLAGPHMASYYASKAYVLSLSEALYEEARPHGVMVTALCPGATESGFGERAGILDTKLFAGRKMSAEAVARIGVEGYRAGHAIVVPGAMNRITAQFSRLMPRFISRRVAASVNQKK